ncbi:MAG: L,D-transpeptidase [Verrucomicrobiota bacterium]
MPHRTHYRLPAARRGRGGRFLWWLAIIILGVGGWLWWTTGTGDKPAPTKLPARVVATPPTPAPPATNVVAKRTAPPTTLLPRPQVIPRSTTKAAVPESTLASAATSFPRPPRDPLETQIALGRRAISSGSVDGVNGSQTRAALAAFQSKAGTSPPVELNASAPSALSLDSSPLTTYTVTSNDLARLQPLSKTWLGKSQQTALDYETILELVAEKAHASPTLIRRLNPAVNWSNIVADTAVQIPAVGYPPPTKAAFATIELAEKRLQVFDRGTNLLAHFPCSIAARVEKRPAGELHVTAIAPNPNYTFDPEVFPESDEARQIKTKLILPPGPNNPVGTAWISLDKPGYGMHGTPNPEQVGRTESHGCFRLANWNAEYLVQLVWVGMPVYVEP